VREEDTYPRPRPRPFIRSRKADEDPDADADERYDADDPELSLDLCKASERRGSVGTGGTSGTSMLRYEYDNPPRREEDEEEEGVIMLAAERTVRTERGVDGVSGGTGALRWGI